MRVRNAVVLGVSTGVLGVGLGGSALVLGESSSSEGEGRWIGTVCPNGDECPAGPVVQVLANAAPGQPGDTLHYRWRSTDGAVLDLDSPTTTWRLPPGPGLHFVYLLVSNGKGGYAEARAVVNTDSIGTAFLAQPTGHPYSAPPAPEVTTGTYQSLSTVPDIAFSLNSTDPGIPYQSSTFHSDLRGRVAVRGIPTNTWNSLNLNVTLADGTGSYVHTENGGLYSNQSPDDYANVSYQSWGVYYPDQEDLSATYDTEAYNGPITTATALLADGSACGTINEFFGVESTAVISGTVNGVPTGPVRAKVSNISHAYLGGFYLADPLANPSPSDIANVTLKCEGTSLTTSMTPGNGSSNQTTGKFRNTFPDSTPPTIGAISVTLDGQSVDATVRTPPSSSTRK